MWAQHIQVTLSTIKSCANPFDLRSESFRVLKEIRRRERWRQKTPKQIRKQVSQHMLERSRREITIDESPDCGLSRFILCHKWSLGNCFAACPIMFHITEIIKYWFFVILFSFAFMKSLLHSVFAVLGVFPVNVNVDKRRRLQFPSFSPLTVRVLNEIFKYFSSSFVLESERRSGTSCSMSQRVYRESRNSGSLELFAGVFVNELTFSLSWSCARAHLKLRPTGASFSSSDLQTFRDRNVLNSKFSHFSVLVMGRIWSSPLQKKFILSRCWAKEILVSKCARGVNIRSSWCELEA